MNRIYPLLAMPALLLGSCSSDDGIKAPDDEGLQVVTIGVLDKSASDSRRALDSSEAAGASDILTVKVIACQGGKVVWAETINQWSSVSSDYSGGRQSQLLISKDDYKFAQGQAYTFYAYGYAAAPNAAISSAAKSSSFSDDQLVIVSGDAPEEIFAGSADVIPDKDGAVSVSLEISRQVAGAFVYVKDIPYIKEANKAAPARYLLLTASNKQNAYYMGHFDAAAANGCRAADDNVVLRADLGDWFAKIEDGGDGTIRAGANWKGAERYANGSVFVGDFVVPFIKSAVEGEPTFTLSLCYDEAGAQKAMSWNLVLPDSDPQLSAYSMDYFNVEWTSVSSVADTKSVFSVLRNNLYSLGSRPSSSPATPGAGADQPQSINNLQMLPMRVSHNWAVIHALEMEE